MIAFTLGATPAPSPVPAGPPPIVSVGADGPLRAGTRWFVEYGVAGLGPGFRFQADSKGTAWWRLGGQTAYRRTLTHDELRVLDAAVARLRPTASTESHTLVFDCYPSIRALRLNADGSVAQRLKPDVACKRDDQAPEVRAVVDLVDAIRKGSP